MSNAKQTDAGINPQDEVRLMDIALVEVAGVVLVLDALLKEQLPACFDAVRQLQNPVIAAYLQILLLSGARAREVLGLRWNDINTKWRGMTIGDKVEGTRVIPFTAYVGQLMAALLRRNEFVFFKCCVCWWNFGDTTQPPQRCLQSWLD